MLLTDQLDFENPQHVTLCCKNGQLTIYIRYQESDMRLTYKLQQEDTGSVPPFPLQQS
jgi:hypothetical protein